MTCHNNLFSFIHSLLIIIHVCRWTISVETRILTTCPRRNMHIRVNNTGHHKCFPCSECPKGTERIEKCTLWHDTECKPCTEGYYNIRKKSTCIPCTVCQPGEKVVRECSSSGDTVCAPCVGGTYSSYRNSDYCSVCSRCKYNEEMIQPCNITHDTICGNCKQEYYRESATGGCLPCQKCHGSSKVVPECYEKNGGYSDRNCMPLERYPDIPSTVTPTIYRDKNGTDDQFYAALIPFLIVILFGTAVIVAAFVCIHFSEKTQRYIRTARDIGRKDDEKKIPLETAEYIHHGKKKKLREILRGWWNYLHKYFIKGKGSEQGDETVSINEMVPYLYENFQEMLSNMDPLSADSGCINVDSLDDDTDETRSPKSASTYLVNMDTGTETDSRTNLAMFGSQALSVNSDTESSGASTTMSYQQHRNTTGTSDDVIRVNVKDSFYDTL